MKWCDLCRRNVEPKRKIGAGSLIAVLVTFGWWILAIPFYKKRCPICGGTHLSVPHSDTDHPGHGHQGGTTDGLQRLELLAKLKDNGSLTQAEYDEQKAKILASM